MAIPGLKAKYEVRGKIRTGEKRTSSRGSEYPAATDYFVGTDPEFLTKGDKPQTLRIVLPHAEVEENFSTGMEWWTKGRQAQKSTLACYTKGDGTALRKTQMKDPDDTVLEEPVGNDRSRIVCRFRECPQFGHNCKPMGRLIFFLEGGATDQVLEHDTKSWNSIERLTAALQGARIKGPLTGRVFDLSVAFESKGANRYPVLSIKEVGVNVENEADVNFVEGIIAIERTKDAGGDERAQLAAFLDQTRPDWRNEQEVIDRIKLVGVTQALASIKQRASA